MNDKELAAIATLEMALAMSRDIPGMESFAEFYLKSRPLKQRMVMHRYLKMKEFAKNDFIAMAEAEGWGKDTAQ